VDLTVSAVVHIFTAHGFKPPPGYFRRLFHLSVRSYYRLRSLGSFSLSCANKSSTWYKLISIARVEIVQPVELFLKFIQYLNRNL